MKGMRLARATSLSIEKLVVNYGTQVALDIPELAIFGNVVALIGHNGAGKSTLIKSILELLPYRGRLKLHYQDNEDELALIPEKHMAFCPETGAVFGDISVESYIKLWCRIKQRDAKFYRHEGSEILELLELAPLLPKLGRELSKGQRRRVQTAIGFLTSPKLFLFDEPFDGLDIQKSQQLSDILAAQSERMSMFISSHRMDVVERLADSVIVLKDGLVVAAGSVPYVCSVLCPQSILVSNLASIEQMLHLLREKYPDAVVHRLGEEITLNGAEIAIDELSGFVEAHDRNGARVVESKAGLVEAMSYHLKG